MYTKILFIEENQKAISWFLILSCVAMCGIYIYLVNLLVFNVFQRQQNEEKISSLRTEVALLEAAYLRESANFTIERAHELGFQDAITDSAYATRNTKNVSLAVRLNEI
jgi:ACR3 family arsenite efflux pump ArsB